MDALLSLANWLLPLAYLALVIDYGTAFFLRVRSHVRSPWVVGAIVFHAGFLVLWGVRFHRLPLASNTEVLSVIALSLAAVYWVTELAGRDRRAGVFVFLLVFLFQHTASTFLGAGLAGGAGAPAGESALEHVWGRLHVLPACFAYTAMALAAVYALLYLIGQRYLKRHRFGLLFDRLPSLELLGRMSWHALLAGFALMTVTIVTGAVVFSRSGPGGGQQALAAKVLAKIFVGSAAWVIYGVAVFGKTVGKWPAGRVSWTAVAGFAVIVVLLVSSFVLS